MFSPKKNPLCIKITWLKMPMAFKHWRSSSLVNNSGKMKITKPDSQKCSAMHVSEEIMQIVWNVFLAERQTRPLFFFFSDCICLSDKLFGNKLSGNQSRWLWFFSSPFPLKSQMSKTTLWEWYVPVWSAVCHHFLIEVQRRRHTHWAPAAAK